MGGDDRWLSARATNSSHRRQRVTRPQVNAARVRSWCSWSTGDCVYLTHSLVQPPTTMVSLGNCSPCKGCIETASTSRHYLYKDVCDLVSVNIAALWSFAK